MLLISFVLPLMIMGKVRILYQKLKTSLAVKLLVVEYRHSDDFQWGFEVINGTSNYLSDVLFNSFDPQSNISLNFDITKRLRSLNQSNLQTLVAKNNNKIKTEIQVKLKSS